MAGDDSIVAGDRQRDLNSGFSPTALYPGALFTSARIRFSKGPFNAI
jgi:hypothetical protein